MAKLKTLVQTRKFLSETGLSIVDIDWYMLRPDVMPQILKEELAGTLKRKTPEVSLRKFLKSVEKPRPTNEPGKGER